VPKNGNPNKVLFFVCFFRHFINYRSAVYSMEKDYKLCRKEEGKYLFRIQTVAKKRGIRTDHQTMTIVRTSCPPHEHTRKERKRGKTKIHFKKVKKPPKKMDMNDEIFFNMTTIKNQNKYTNQSNSINLVLQFDFLCISRRFIQRWQRSLNITTATPQQPLQRGN
jgi:hypothetical protein